MTVDDRTYWTPAPLEERSEEVDTDESDVTSRNHRLVLLWWCDAHKQTDVHHCQTHGDRSPEKRLATSERVGGEDQEQAAHDHLDDTVDAGGEETGLGAGETEVLEDLRSICDTSVTGSVLIWVQCSPYSSCCEAVSEDSQMTCHREDTCIAFVPVIC